LLDVLEDHQQSLGRVLKQLVDRRLCAAEGRRETTAASGFLFVTPKGEQLAMKLAGLQTERICAWR